MIEHDVSSYCVIINKDKCDKLCQKYCFEKIELNETFSSICDLCFNQFTENNIDRILKEIDDNNQTTILWYAGYYMNRNEYDKCEYYLRKLLRYGMIRVFHSFGRLYAELKKYDLMKKFYMLSIDYENYNSMVNLGIYYQYVEKNNDLAETYYLCASQYGNTCAMYYLGNYYQSIKEYDLMKKYYLMAIQKGDLHSMHKLAIYYENVEKNYDEMKKYYLMAIYMNNNDDNKLIPSERSNICSMYKLAIYYENVEKNYELMEKYYLLGVRYDDTLSMNRLGSYYQSINEYELMKKYYLMAINKGNIGAMHALAEYYFNIEKNSDDAIKYILMIIQKGKNNNSKYYDAIISAIAYYDTINVDYDKKEKYILMFIHNINYDETDKYCVKNISPNFDILKTLHLDFDTIVFVTILIKYYWDNKHYDLMMKYLIKAVEFGDKISTCNLGKYYHYIESNYTEMKKYYIQAIEKGDCDAMYNLGQYYYEIEHNVDLATKYLMMAIDNGDKDGIIYLFQHVKMNIINIYFSTTNKQLVVDTCTNAGKNNIQNFLNKCSICVCDICYTEMECIEQNNLWVCGLCWKI